jgi:hypothetical protein
LDLKVPLDLQEGMVCLVPQDPLVLRVQKVLLDGMVFQDLLVFLGPWGHRDLQVRRAIVFAPR